MARLPPLRAVLRPGVVVVLVVVALLVALRIVLPIAATNYANRILDSFPGYDGHIEDIDFALWRGASSIEGVRIDQIDAGKRQLLLNTPRIDASVAWRALLHGSLVAEVEIAEPVINVVTAARPEEIEKEKVRLKDLVERFRALLPFVIDRFAVTNGELHFHDPTATPAIDIYVEQFDLIARNLTNSARLSDTLWGTVSASGRAMGSGRLDLEMRLNPNEKRPTYDLAFELEDLRLPTLNNYLKHYLHVVARDGRLSLYAESVAREGWFEGYVKPIVKDLDILEVKQEEKSIAEAVKGFFVKVLAQIFENEPKEQVATRIEFSGSFENPEISVWDAVVLFMRNAFVRALPPGLDASVAPGQARKAEGAGAAPPQDDAEPSQRQRDR